MRPISLLFVAALSLPVGGALLAACSPAREHVGVCPSTWEATHDSQEGCLPPSDDYAAAQSRLGAGVLGFARHTRRHCSDGCSTLSEELLADVEVRAYRFEPGQPSAEDRNNPECGAISDRPVAITKTNSEGVYALALPAGQYLLGMPRPSAGATCQFFQKTAVEDGRLVVVPLVFVQEVDAD